MSRHRIGWAVLFPVATAISAVGTYCLDGRIGIALTAGLGIVSALFLEQRDHKARQSGQKQEDADPI